MIKNKILKTTALAVCMIMTISCSVPSFAVEDIKDASSIKNVEKISEEVKTVNEDLTEIYKDLKEHWAKDTFKKAYEDGIIRGFEDYTMRPDSIITPAQMITVITRMLNSNLEVSVDDLNLSDDCWYKEALSKALAAEIIDKSDVSGINSKMCRKDSIIMMAKAFQLSDADPDLTAASKYSDFSNLTTAEKIIYASMINKKYIQGWEGKLQLNSNITRAEFITILYRVIDSSIDLDKDDDVQTVEAPTLVSGQKFKSQNVDVNNDLWLDGKIKDVDIENSNFGRLILMSDEISSLKVNNSNIEKLVLASKKGDIDLDCTGIKTINVGNGGGTVKLNPQKNNIEITGNDRTVFINGESEKVSISGSNNNIIFDSSANSDYMIVYGDNNNIAVNSNIKEIIVKGKNNVINGIGKADTFTSYNNSTKSYINIDNKVDKADYGIEGMTVTVSAPSNLKSGNYLTAALNLNNAPKDKKIVKLTWYMNGKAVKTDNVEIPSQNSISLSYYVDYSTNIADVIKLSCKVEYTTSDGKYQSTESSSVSVNIEKPYVPVKATVETVYKGNYTTQWAISHNLSNSDKENFVNSKGYSSSSKYLIWVNIGTQYTTVFQGSKGNWKLVRSGLVSTGANDCTPRGVFKTTYKQTNWTTDTYTVKPIVRFYGQGYAMHSRLYKPGTTELKSGNNGVGYPLSHGCVRMQADDIQWIYDNVPNGTTIVVY